MSRQIVIIGGGISGLAVLHYLNKKYAGDENVEIQLLEKNDHPGGTIRSLKRQGCLFETGPNGFLDSKPRTLEFINDLELDECLVRANEESGIRYLSVNNTLHTLPTTPISFLSFKLLNPLEKLRILGEFFIPRGNDPGETVYDFGKRRLGEKFAQVFLDPMVSGIYGGDAQRTNLKAIFPKIYNLEQEYGSLFKAMIKTRRASKASGDNKKSRDSAMGSPAGTLTSFKAGMSRLIEAVELRYKKIIHLNREVESIHYKDGKYEIFSVDKQRYVADELFICAPAYSAGPMVEHIDDKLCDALGKINYAPMAVLGLVFPLECFRKKPRGYGYLVPSSEKKEVLGVLFESNIFPGRCHQDQVLLRMMIGGARHSNILSKTKDELIDLALNEIAPLMEAGINRKKLAEEPFFIGWGKAIPQYDATYCEALKVIEEQLRQNPGLHLVANYLGGVSLNDCIENACQRVKKSSVF